MPENKDIAIAEEMPVNDLAPARTYAIAELAKPEDNTFCSVNPELGADAKKLIYNASNNPTHKIDDFINKQIALKDLFVEIIEIADDPWSKPRASSSSTTRARATSACRTACGARSRRCSLSTARQPTRSLSTWSSSR